MPGSRLVPQCLSKLQVMLLPHHCCFLARAYEGLGKVTYLVSLWNHFHNKPQAVKTVWSHGPRRMSTVWVGVCACMCESTGRDVQPSEKRKFERKQSDLLMPLGNWPRKLCFLSPTAGAAQRPDFLSAHWMPESVSAQFLQSINMIILMCTWSKSKCFFDKIHFNVHSTPKHVNLDLKPLCIKFQFTLE
jgi:hypothetical protein